jgi:hypothetical protein
LENSFLTPAPPSVERITTTEASVGVQEPKIVMRDVNHTGKEFMSNFNILCKIRNRSRNNQKKT